VAVIRTLVIGFGNTLRTDDGAGIWTAENLSVLQMPGVVVECAHQLSLDLLEDFASFDRIVFIDAAVDGEDVAFEPVGRPSVAVPPSAHHLTPADLLNTYGDLYSRQIDSFLCTIRGEEFEFGTELTGETKKRAESALSLLVGFLSEK
jgi:hydrogenase maturation protease